MGSVASPERYRFGAFEVQVDERRLLSDGTVVSLRPRAFDLLAAFVDRAGHLVTKDELLDRVWPGVVVEEAALHVQVSALRKVLGADAIATVSGQGYRFALPVTKVEPRSKHNLPSQLTSFVGREQEIAADEARQLRRQVVVGRRVRCLDSRHPQSKAVTLPGDRGNRFVTKDLAQGGHLHVQCRFFDHDTRPYPVQQLVLGDEVPRPLDHGREQIEGARPQQNRCTVA